LSADDRTAIVSLYEQRLAEFGNDIRTVGWKSVEEQELRFRVLCDIGDLRNSRVCDVGSGFGDLLPYLRHRFGDVEYLGVDLVPGLVEEASRLHQDARFVVRNLLTDPTEERFDYCLLSGALNIRVTDNMALAADLLSRMFELADVGVAANFLSSNVNFERPINFHYDPSDVLRVAKEITPWVTLRHDYPLWEFSVYLYREPVS
jgi:SAM-dependent methyltransferase